MSTARPRITPPQPQFSHGYTPLINFAGKYEHKKRVVVERCRNQAKTQPTRLSPFDSNATYEGEIKEDVLPPQIRLRAYHIFRRDAHIKMPYIASLALLEHYHPHIAQIYKDRACKEMKKEWLQWRDSELAKCKDRVHRAVFRINHPKSRWMEDKTFMEMINSRDH
ncbi:hypothetical protein GLAREA_05872 [Glarea lozoyensis ATCC 20868]|uniref:Uncharacterized protein n=1 Tax=Glarea lozoyensis (strain ATCC 20868 / MF5171) TaxID=1116229 RepID=S3D510_GLAL2|nr:uncharacterized protein GLAREA_05872 [Glarea lozoyensis ATCC 20868]EPE32860.1 hypothetical protein GLAREA_05872 [Glarea lozoyensis ATCC 20868]